MGDMLKGVLVSTDATMTDSEDTDVLAYSAG